MKARRNPHKAWDTDNIVTLQEQPELLPEVDDSIVENKPGACGQQGGEKVDGGDAGGNSCFQRIRCTCSGRPLR
jgi:hypothetical protein